MILARILLGIAQALPREEVRAEHFVLEVRPADAAAEAVEVGVACLRRRTIDGRRQLELECLFRRESAEGEDEHVLHVEREPGPGPALVWREWGAQRSRSLTAERTEDGTGILLVETSRGGIPRATIQAPVGLVLPLELLERAREGRAESGRFARLEPLSRSFEPIDVKTTHGVKTTDGEVRVVELAREDGSSAGRFEFRGTELVGFQWQEGELHARRVTEEAYARKLAAGAPLARQP